MIEVTNESGQEIDETELIRLASFALKELRIHPLADLSILLVEESAMSGYHKKFMDLDGPTDVMSFPMDELRPPGKGEKPPLGMLGDIVLCPTVTAAQAAENGRTPAEEQNYLLIHGLLHLLGYDHAELAEKTVMFALNDRIIADWNKHKAGELG